MPANSAPEKRPERTQATESPAENSPTGAPLQILAPELTSGHILIMDKLPAHKIAGVRTVIEAAGAATDFGRILSTLYSGGRTDRTKLTKFLPVHRSPRTKFSMAFARASSAGAKRFTGPHSAELLIGAASAD